MLLPVSVPAKTGTLPQYKYPNAAKYAEAADALNPGETFEEKTEFIKRLKPKNSEKFPYVPKHTPAQAGVYFDMKAA